MTYEEILKAMQDGKSLQSKSNYDKYWVDLDYSKLNTPAAFALVMINRHWRLKPQEMNFITALELAINGRKVARLSWNCAWIQFLNGELQLRDSNGYFKIYRVSQWDIQHNDWVIYDGE